MVKKIINININNFSSYKKKLSNNKLNFIDSSKIRYEINSKEMTILKNINTFLSFIIFFNNFLINVIIQYSLK